MVTFPNQNSQGPVQLSFKEEEVQTPSLTEQALNSRTTRYDVALGDDSPGEDVIFNNLSRNNEEAIRNHANLVERKKAFDSLSEDFGDVLSSTRIEDLTPEQFQLLNDFREQAANVGGQNSLSLERMFANKASSLVAEGSGVSEFIDDPTVDPILSGFHSHSTKMEIARDLFEQVDARVTQTQQNRAFANVSEAELDTLEQAIPLMSASNLFNATEEVDDDGVLLGTNLRTQITNLYALPPEEFKEKLQETLDTIIEDNPQDALTFVSNVLAMGAGTEALENTFTALDLADISAFVGLSAAVGAIAFTGTARRVARKSLRDGITPASEEQLEDLVRPVPVKTPEAEEIIRRHAIGGRNRPSQQELEEVLTEFGTPLPESTTFFRGFTHGQPVASEGQTAISVSSELDTATSFSIARNENIAEDQGADLNFSKSFPVARIQVPAGVHTLNIDEFLGETLTREAEIVLPEGRLERVDQGSSIVVIDGFQYEVQTYIFTPKTNNHFIENLSQVVPDVTESLSNPSPRVSDVLDAAGDVEGATATKVLAAVENLATDRASVPSTARNLKESLIEMRPVFDGVPSILNPEYMFRKGSSSSTGVTNNVLRELQDNTVQFKQFFDNLTNSVGAERNPVEVVEQSLKQLRNDIDDKTNNLNTHIVNERMILPEQDFADRAFIELDIGSSLGVPFQTRRQAQTFSDRFFKTEPTEVVKLKTNQFVVRFRKSVDERDNDFLTSGHFLDENTSPESFATIFRGLIGNPNRAVSKLSEENRKITTHLPAELFSHVTEATKKIGRVKDTRALDIVWDDHRDFVQFHPVTKQPTQLGRYFEDVKELENFFLSHPEINRLPTDQEILAYFTYRQLNDLDYIVRNNNILRQLSSNGLVESQISGSKSSHWFHTKPVTDLDSEFRHGEEWSIAFVGNRQSSVKHSRDMSSQDVSDMIEKLKTDGHEVQIIANPRGRPLKSLGDEVGTSEVVNYIVSPRLQVRPLQLKQLPYNTGIHRTYTDPFFGRSPMFEGDDYIGNVTIFSARTQKEANLVTDELNRLRELYLTGDLDSMRRTAAHGVDPEKLIDNFKEGILDPNMPIRPFRDKEKFSDEELFQLKPTARNIRNKRLDLTEELDAKFATTRDPPLDRFLVRGTDRLPLFLKEKPRLLDAKAALKEGLGSSVHSSVVDNYVKQTSRAFVEQFNHILQGDLPLLRADARNTIANPTFIPNADARQVALAKGQSRIFNTFVGVQKNEVDRLIDWTWQHGLDILFNHRNKVPGSEGALDTLSLVDLHRVKDPLQFFRNLAFHLKLGLLNPIQSVLQSQTLAVILAVDPKRGMSSLLAGTIGEGLWATGAWNSPTKIDFISNKLNSLGVYPHFKESFETMLDTGWHLIGGDVATIDVAIENPIFRSKTKSFLNKAAIFFTEAERNLRITSWMQAYREARDVKPTGTFSRREINNILTRADLLTVNMTRNSNAMWQQGALSIPTQFSSYSARLSELLLGSQFTGMERARVMILFAALYGVPVTATAGLPISDYYEDIKQWFFSKGINPNEGALEVFMDGLIPTIISEVSGTDIDVNFAQRFGPGQAPVIDLFWEAVKGDISFLSALSGPSGSIFTETVQDVIPIAKSIVPLMEGKPGSLNVTATTFLDLARNLSSVDSVTRTVMALNTQRWFSKNGVLLTEDVDTLESILFMWGLSPEEVGDAFLRLNNLDPDARLRAASNTEKWIIQSIRRGVTAKSEGNQEEGQRWMELAYAAMEGVDLLPAERTRLVQRALQDQISIVELANKKEIEAQQGLLGQPIRDAIDDLVEREQ